MAFLTTTNGFRSSTPYFFFLLFSSEFLLTAPFGLLLKFSSIISPKSLKTFCAEVKKFLAYIYTGKLSDHSATPELLLLVRPTNPCLSLSTLMFVPFLMILSVPFSITVCNAFLSPIVFVPLCMTVSVCPFLYYCLCVPFCIAVSVCPLSALLFVSGTLLFLLSLSTFLFVSFVHYFLCFFPFLHYF
jgi:hypothetical protein